MISNLEYIKRITKQCPECGNMTLVRFEWARTTLPEDYWYWRCALEGVAGRDRSYYNPQKQRGIILSTRIYCEASYYDRSSGSTYTCTLKINHEGPHKDLGEPGCGVVTWTDAEHFET